MTALTHPERAARRAAIREALLAGEDRSAIAARFGVSEATVSTCKPPRFRYTARGPALRFNAYKIVAMLQNTDLNLTQIGLELGLTRERVRQISVKAADAGIKFKSRGRQ